MAVERACEKIAYSMAQAVQGLPRQRGYRRSIEWWADRRQWSAVWLGRRLTEIGSKRTCSEQTWLGSGFFILAVLEDPDGPIAQLDRVTDFYSVGCRFESCWDRQYIHCDRRSRARCSPLGHRQRNFGQPRMVLEDGTLASSTPAVAIRLVERDARSDRSRPGPEPIAAEFLQSARR